MSILEELNRLLAPLGIPIETGYFSGKPPAEYLVITPMADMFEQFADNTPHYETQEARLSLYTKGSYTKLKNRIVKALLGNTDLYITDRRYIGWDEKSGLHQYSIDVLQNYVLKEDNQ